MIKKLRDKAKSKKGFTLVELIVVIVIILILAAVLVPQLLRYVDRANQANVRADAATILSQLQADFADSKVENDEFPGNNYNVNGVNVTEDASGTATAAADAAIFTVTSNNNEDVIVRFQYNNDAYTATWTQADGWEVAQNQ